MGNYDQQVEAWKLNLVKERIHEHGFRCGDIDEAHQDVMLAVINFKYDPEKSKGASERTALTTVIDNQLLLIKRGRARYKKNVQKYRELCVPHDLDNNLDLKHMEHQRRHELEQDVQSLISRLDPMDQRVCKKLMDGEPIFHVAKSLDMSRYDVARSVGRIREILESLTLGPVN